jgi:hypothetical protein
MDWLEKRRHDERRRLLNRYRARADSATGNARWGVYDVAAADARECAGLVRPLSPTLGALWDIAADCYQRNARPPLRLFEDDGPD